MMGLAAESTDSQTIRIRLTYPKASHDLQHAREKNGRGGQIGRTKGGMNNKLHAVADAKGRPIRYYMSASQVSDQPGAAVSLAGLPRAGWLPVDRGYAVNSLREA